MSDAIDKAANAFDVSMGRAPGNTQNSGGAQETMAVEQVFGNLGELDDDSVSQAGGDLVDEEEDQQPPQKAEKEPVDDIDDLDSILYGEDDGDSDESDESEEDSDDEESEAEDDEDDDAETMHTVMVDGEEQQVSTREALDGYIRTKTFNQRMNEVDQLNKEVRKHGEFVVEQRQQYLQNMEDAEELLSSIIPEEPDWDALHAEDPQKAYNMRRQYDHINSRIDEIRKKRAEAAEQVAQDTHRQNMEFAQAEFPKFARIANWKNKGQQEKDLKSMERTAAAVGFTKEEISQVYDSRMLNVLLKASKYDRMMAARPKPSKQRRENRQARSGKQTSTAPRGVDRASRRLKQTGSIEDATAVFQNILETKPRRSRRK